MCLVTSVANRLEKTIPFMGKPYLPNDVIDFQAMKSFNDSFPHMKLQLKGEEHPPPQPVGSSKLSLEYRYMSKKQGFNFQDAVAGGGGSSCTYKVDTN